MTPDSRPHIQFAISGHGFGHIGQCAPIINSLTQQHPYIKISVRSEAPSFKLREKLGESIELQYVKLDIGMNQQDALSIDYKKSEQAYRDFHQNWSAKVQQEADILSKQNIDLIIANASYLSLAAAKLAGIPCIAFCSLNWEEIYGYYFGEKNPGILKQISDAYRCADFFICPEPAMPMPSIENRVNIGPVAQIITGPQDHPIPLKDSDKLVLISWGGMGLELDIRHWPETDSIHFIVPDEQATMERNNIYTLKQLGISYHQALHHCDLLIAKPGYGTFVEAAMIGKPIAYLPRIDWPEMDILVKWYPQFANCSKIGTTDVISGSFIFHLDQLINHAPTENIQANGNEEATAIILEHLQIILAAL